MSGPRRGGAHWARMRGRAGEEGPRGCSSRELLPFKGSAPDRPGLSMSCAKLRAEAMLSAARRKVERGRLRVVLIAVSFGLGGSSACVFWDSNDWSDKYGRSSGSDAASDESIVREGSADGGQEGGSEAGSSGEGGHIALVGSSTGSNVSSTSQFVSV